jgi:hypothetical protein
MLSVIVPTMWKCESFSDFIYYVAKLSIVGEIIIINNDVENTPSHRFSLEPKIKVLNQENNIYVNPAWNLGVLKSKYDNLCFLSDDVVVDLKAFYMASEFLNNTENAGVLAICPGQHCPGVIEDCPEEFKHLRYTLTDGTIQIVPHAHTDDMSKHISRGYGSLFFLKKENWFFIPERIKIWSGDSIQWGLNEHFKRQNYLMKNAFFYTIGNGTVRHINNIDEICANEYKELEEFLSETMSK